MDRIMFEARVDKLKKGEYLNDTSVFNYANNAICEYRQLFDAMRTCCALQKQRLDMLRQMNRSMEKALREARQRVDELEQKVAELDGTADINSVFGTFTPINRNDPDKGGVLS